jgi:hypothetical protein
VLRIGPEVVFGRLWKESGIQEVLESLLEARRYEFDVERAIYLTVLHRLFATTTDERRKRLGARFADEARSKLSLVEKPLNFLKIRV